MLGQVKYHYQTYFPHEICRLSGAEIFLTVYVIPPEDYIHTLHTLHMYKDDVRDSVCLCVLSLSVTETQRQVGQESCGLNEWLIYRFKERGTYVYPSFQKMLRDNPSEI